MWNRPFRRVLTTREPRRLLVTTLTLVVIVLSSCLVAASPYALRAWDPRSDDWERLSWIGQTYGAASALLAVFALIGIAVSLVMQAREVRAAREQTLRAVHTDLLRMAMEDEVYRDAWGPFFAAGDPDHQRRHMYLNLIISNLQMRWDLRAISEQHLRSTTHVLFSGDAGRRFWAEGRELRSRAVSSRRERNFHRILDEEYEHALRDPARPPAPAHPAPPHRAQPTPSRPGRATRRTPWLLAGGAMIGTAAIIPALRALARRIRTGQNSHE